MINGQPYSDDSNPMVKDIHYYRRKFAPKSKENPIGLNISRSAGEAPNKPVLLLAVIELMSRGEIQHNRIYLSPELIAAFFKLWSQLEIHRRADIGLPFFHLRSDGFWHFRANPGYEWIELRESKIKVRAIKPLKETVQYAYLDPELSEILQNPTLRDELTFVLINSYFFDKAQGLRNSLQLNAFEDLKKRLLSTGGKVYQPEELEQEDDQEKIVRDGAFRRVVTSIYEYRCAFCGLQVFNNLENIVDGSHIKPFAKFYDDRFDNGLSLCKNHHWAFDKFWFSINNDYTIIVAGDLRENSPHTRPMREFQGEFIRLPANQLYYPRPDALAWHRQAFYENAPAS